MSPSIDSCCLRCSTTGDRSEEEDARQNTIFINMLIPGKAPEEKWAHTVEELNVLTVKEGHRRSSHKRVKQWKKDRALPSGRKRGTLGWWMKRPGAPHQVSNATSRRVPGNFDRSGTSWLTFWLVDTKVTQKHLKLIHCLKSFGKHSYSFLQTSRMPVRRPHPETQFLYMTACPIFWVEI